ncbi:MAG TPA: DnaB-like helicase N-terminal domain-containing protein, partial [Kofleriaceae bacterium]|nr:DnaB-like helicase N-terminal domain-containing protein [Kofleriaceae bacterium]
MREDIALPYNLTAEASILGGIILSNEVLSKLDALEPGDFHDWRHGVVFTAMRNLEARREPIDVVTLENEIAKQGKLDAVGGPAFFGELVLQVPTADNVVEYTTIVRSHAQVRRVALLASDLLQRAQRWGSEPVDELVAQAKREYEELAKRHVEASEPIKLYTVGDALEEQARFAEQPVYPTPWPTLNESIGFGGLLGTQVYTVAAGTGRGKTTFVTELGAHSAGTVPVIVASYEMKPGYFVARKAAGVLGVHSNQIIRGEVSMNAVMAAMPYGRLFFMHKPSLRHLRIAIDRLAQRFGAAPLVVVDYLQKLADEIAKRQQRPDLRMATTEASSSLLELASVVAMRRSGRCCLFAI